MLHGKFSITVLNIEVYFLNKDFISEIIFQKVTLEAIT